MKYLAKLFCLMMVLFGLRPIQAQELRGAWIARDSLTSKVALAAAMDTLASNNFNVVYVNAWSRGYPLWNSQVFSNHTGLRIDPGYANRDVMAEAVAEGHRNGLHVVAWFEYGFVGGYTGYLPGTNGMGKIFDVHPDWIAKNIDGTTKDASNFYWMAHTRHDVQQFLIDLATEVATSYDLDGIEFDRIRYSNTGYGYDDYTVSLYQGEHGGQSPPIQTNDTSWVRWRADKLNNFSAAAYDSIKAVYPQFVVCNAPSSYSSSANSAYNNYCQDWIQWVNSGKIDNLQIQSYQSTSTAFASIINFISSQVKDKSKIFPSFAIKPNSTVIPPNEQTNLVKVTRDRGYSGNCIWYHVDLATSKAFANLRANVYTSKTYPPYAPADWRSHTVLTSVHDTTNAIRSGNWLTNTSTGSNSLYSGPGRSATIDYQVDIPVSGKYEVYAYIVTGANNAPLAEFVVIDAQGTRITNLVNQSTFTNSRWYKLGDYLFASGRQSVLQLSNRSPTGSQQVSADAVMLSLNRRLSVVPKLTPWPVAGSFGFQIAGNVGQKITIQSSTNLLDWNSTTNVTLTNAKTNLAFPSDMNQPKGFYRAVLAP
jgi:uncharacterized lipoprotein YddW (UPF0748 family)